VIINDLNLQSVTAFPDEADSPLIIDSNTVLSEPVALQLLKSVRWRNPQRIQAASSFEYFKLSGRQALNLLW